MVILHTHNYCCINVCLLYWFVSRWHSSLLNLSREDEVLRFSGSSRKWEMLTRDLLVMRRALQGNFLWWLLCLTRTPHPGWCPKLLEPQLQVLEVGVKIVEKIREAGTLSTTGSPMLRGVGCASVVGNHCLLVLGRALKHSLLSFHCYGLWS